MVTPKQKKQSTGASLTFEQLNQSLQNHQIELQMQQDELERTSKELLEARQQFDALRDNAPVAYLTHDSQGFVIESNKRARRLIGLQPCQQEFSLTNLLEEKDQELLGFHLQQVRATREPSSVELVFHNGAENRFVLLETQPPRGEVYQSLMVDVTKQRESEQIHKLLDSQLLQSQKMEILHELSGGIAHDFNNILQALVMQVEMAIELLGDESSQVSEVINHIRDTTYRGTELTKRLLAFSRRAPLEKRRADLNELIEGSLELVSRSLGKDWKIIFDPLNEQLGVWVDPVQIEQVVLNLCLNARDAMPQGGVIIVETDRHFLESKCTKSNTELLPGSYAVVSIRDEGTGIPPEALSRIFEPYFTTKPVGKGTGLGMPIAHSILQQHQGAIEIASTKKTGTEIKFYIPSFKIPRMQNAKDFKQTQARRELSGRVLICDDEPSITHVLRYYLSRHGLDVISADSGANAIDLIENGERFDLLLTDVVMPGANGLSISEKFREKYPESSIVIMSGHGDSVLSERALRELGAVFLPKPFKLDGLYEKLGLKLLCVS